MKLYHVSPSENNSSIFEGGIDPAYSKGKLKASWFVNDDMLMWAIAHVSGRHSVNANLISVWIADIPETSTKRTRWTGVHTCATTTQPMLVMSAIEAINQRAMAAQQMADDYASE